MKITLEPTADLFRTDDGIPVRAWRGTTDRGTHVIAFIAAIAAPAGEDQSELLAELREIPGPATADAFMRGVDVDGSAV